MESYMFVRRNRTNGLSISIKLISDMDGFSLFLKAFEARGADTQKKGNTFLSRVLSMLM